MALIIRVTRAQVFEQTKKSMRIGYGSERSGSTLYGDRAVRQKRLDEFLAWFERTKADHDRGLLDEVERDCPGELGSSSTSALTTIRKGKTTQSGVLPYLIERSRELAKVPDSDSPTIAHHVPKTDAKRLRSPSPLSSRDPPRADDQEGHRAKRRAVAHADCPGSRTGQGTAALGDRIDRNPVRQSQCEPRPIQIDSWGSQTIWIPTNLGFGFLARSASPGWDGAAADEHGHQHTRGLPVRLRRSGLVDRLSTSTSPSLSPCARSLRGSSSRLSDFEPESVEMSAASYDPRRTLHIACPRHEQIDGDDTDDLGDRDVKFALHVSDLAACLPRRSFAERLMNQIWNGTLRHESDGMDADSSILRRYHPDDLDIFQGIDRVVLPILVTDNPPNSRGEAFPNDDLPPITPSSDCASRLEQMDLRGVWTDVGATTFSMGMDEILHGVCRVLGRRLTLDLSCVRQWIFRETGQSFVSAARQHERTIKQFDRAIDTSKRLPTNKLSRPSQIRFWSAGGFDERPSAMISKVLTIAHGYVLFAAERLESSAPVTVHKEIPLWEVVMLGPKSTLTVPFGQRVRVFSLHPDRLLLTAPCGHSQVVMMHLTNSAVIETEACHHLCVEHLRRVLEKEQAQCKEEGSLIPASSSYEIARSIKWVSLRPARLISRTVRS